jgi:hypothetical protein
MSQIKRMFSKLDFAHFGEALSLSQARVQKIPSFVERKNGAPEGTGSIDRPKKT